MIGTGISPLGDVGVPEIGPQRVELKMCEDGE